MPRRLRLSVYRKNQYSKKQTGAVKVEEIAVQSLDDSVNVKISLPLDCFLSALSPNVSNLKHMVKSTSLLPPGKIIGSYGFTSWILLSGWFEMADTEYFILSKLCLKEDIPHILCSIVIDSNFTWKILVGSEELKSSMATFFLLYLSV